MFTIVVAFMSFSIDVNLNNYWEVYLWIDIYNIQTLHKSVIIFE